MEATNKSLAPKRHRSRGQGTWDHRLLQPDATEGWSKRGEVRDIRMGRWRCLPRGARPCLQIRKKGYNYTPVDALNLLPNELLLSLSHTYNINMGNNTNEQAHNLELVRKLESSGIEHPSRKLERLSTNL